VSGAVVAATAVVVAAASGLLSGWAVTLAGKRSGWTSWWRLALLGGLGGAGAAMIADGVAELVAFAALALGCAVLVAVDLAAHRLPDVVTGPTAAALLIGLAVAAAGADPAAWSDLGRAVLAGLALGAGFLVLALISPQALGLGDVKLAALLGVFLGWFGWSAVLLGVVATFVLGGLVALLLLATRRASRTTALAFGPALVLGAAVAAGLTHAGASLTP
jgi:leader peptidase (prepilin peptidase)/N-methyltransferase